MSHSIMLHANNDRPVRIKHSGVRIGADGSLYGVLSLDFDDVSVDLFVSVANAHEIKSEASKLHATLVNEVLRRAHAEDRKLSS